MNDIKSLLQQIITRCGLLPIFCSILMLLVCVGCTQKEYVSQHPDLHQVDTLLWARDFVGGEELLHTIDTNQLSEADRNIWYLYQEEFNIKNKKHEDTHQHLAQLLPYFESHKMYRYAGQAHLIQAKLLSWQNQEEEAMRVFKLAEEDLLHTSYPPLHLIAELYYQMGLCYKAIDLKDEAYANCEKSIYYARQVDYAYFISGSYQVMANTYMSMIVSDSLPIDTMVNLYDSALYYNQFTRNPNGNYHILSYNKSHVLRDTCAMIYHSKYLVDSLNFYLPADILVSYYIDHNRLDSAKYYLDKLAEGTVNQSYNTRQKANMYYYLEARYTAATGNMGEAYQLMLRTYEDLLQFILDEEDTRTYAVSRKYDVEKERRERLETEVEKQHLWLVLLLVAALSSMAILLFFVYHERSKRKHTQLAAQNALQQQRIETMHKELNIKRDSLRNNLLQRIELTYHLRLQQMKTGEADKKQQLPVWAQEFIDSQLLTNEQISEDLCKEFDALYYNMLQLLQADYPRLTRADLLMCILITLELSVTDVCILFGVPKRTVWNRRNRIKKHIGLEQDIDLEDWLQDYAMHVAVQHP